MSLARISDGCIMASLSEINTNCTVLASLAVDRFRCSEIPIFFEADGYAGFVSPVVVHCLFGSCYLMELNYVFSVANLYFSVCLET